MKILIAVTLCLISFTLLGQNPYAKIIQHPGNPLYARVFDADVSDDGRIAVLGQAELGSTITIYSDTASMIWSQRFAPASVNMSYHPLQVSWMPNNDILVTGYNNLLPFGRNIGMVRMDQTGAVIWTQMFRDSTLLQGNDISRALPLANGDIAVLVSSPVKVTLVRFDATGQYLWAKSYPEVPHYGDLQIDLQEYPNGDLLLRDDDNILRVNAAGDVLFSWDYQFPGAVVNTPQVYFPRVAVLSDGGFLFQSIVDYYPALIRCDSMGTIQWAKKYDYSDFYQPWFTRMIELPDSTILAFPTSGWNTTIGLHIDQAGDPISRIGIESDYRLWPGSSAYWPQPFIGRWNGYYHFLGSVQQVVNGGFTLEQSVVFRLNDDLLTPCVSVVDNFTAVDITSIPPPLSTDSAASVSCQQWTFAYELDSTFYTTTDACPLILSLSEQQHVDLLSVHPSITAAGETVTISISAELRASRWLLIDMSGRRVDEGTIADASGGAIITSSSCAPGIYSLVVLNRSDAVVGRSRILLQ